MTDALHAAHFFCAAYMTGIIWFVQLVHYPMLHLAVGENPQAGHREYTRRMGFVVMPVMLAEVALQGIWLAGTPSTLSWAGAGLLFIVWASTFFLQVPCHQKLEKTFDISVQKKLVQTNWIRTVAWTSRAILVGWWF